MLGVALFGAGVIGSVHAGNVAANSNCRLVHVVDQDIERAQRLATSRGGAPGSSIETALEDPDVAAVIIASSTSAHQEHVLACAEAGKALLCEKPVVDSLDGARACVDAVARAGVTAATGFN